MDGNEAQAFVLRTLYGLCADALIPFTEEGIDIGAVVGHERGHLIVEGTEVGTLAGHTV